MKYLLQFAFILTGIITLSSLSAQNKTGDFSSTSLIHFPSTVQVEKDSLETIFFHRFGNAEQPLEDWLGLDNGATVQISADYGLTKNLSLGLSRSTDFKTYEVRGKFSPEFKSLPFSMSIFAAWGQETEDKEYTIGTYLPVANLPQTGNTALQSKLTEINRINYKLTYDDRQSSMLALLLSRKITRDLSLQLTPVYVHRNYVPARMRNDRWGLGIGGQWKLTRNISLIFETILTEHRDFQGDDYRELDRNSYGNARNYTADEINGLLRSNPASLPAVYFRNIVYDKPVPYYYIPFSLGVDISTGGHIFQIFASNSSRLAHTQLLRGARYDYRNRDFLIGFNISRLFWFRGGKNREDPDMEKEFKEFEDLKNEDEDKKNKNDSKTP